MPLTKEQLIAERDSAHRRIAELEKSEKKHLATQEAYHTLVDHSLQGLLIVQDGGIVFANRRFSEMSGYTVEELLNASPEKLKAGIHPEDRELVWRRNQERLDGKPVPDRYEYRALRKDGKVFWVETFSALIEYRGKPAVQSAIIDITANKLSQEALHTERQKLMTTIGLVPYGVVLIDRDGTYRYANPKFIELFGYDMNEIPNGKEWFRKAFPDPEYRNEVIAIWVNDFRNASPGENILRTFNVTCKNGKERIVNFITVLLETGEYILTCSDITEVKQVEAALRESRQNLHSIIQGSPTPAFVIGKNHMVMYWNKALEDITGIRADDVVGTTGHWKAFYETERPCLADILVDGGAGDISQWYREKHKKSTLSEDAYEATDFFPKLGKKGKWLHFTASIIRNSRGDLVGAIETLEDITSYKRIEQEIQESEKRYRTIFENTGTATIVCGEDLIIRMANTESEKLSGYSKKEIEGGKSCLDFVVPDDREALLKCYQLRGLAQDELPGSYEFRLIHKKGQVKNVFISVAMIPGTDNRVASLMDITDLKQAQEALRFSEERYRILIENANDVIVVIQDGFIKFYNPKTLSTLGYTDSDLITKPFSHFIHPEDAEMVLDKHNRRLQGEEIPPVYSFRLFNKSGEVSWLEINSVLIQWEGRPATLNFIRDITEQMKLEAQLIQAHKMEAIGTLAGGIAHDFNNLLMGIQGYASLMLSDMDAHHPYHKRLKKIEEHVSSGADLTRQLLGFARGGKYEIKATDMNDVVRRTSNMFGRTKKEIGIHRKYKRDLWPVEVDRGQIEQVLLNLYVNAWQAMPDGGDLYLETSNVVLEEESARSFSVEPGRYVKLSVTDTGTGMDKRTQERIFEPFFTTKEMGRGTGLGLASAYGIIKGHNGIIHVFSEPSHGTTFNIYFPASLKMPETEARISGELLKGEGTILLVDDEEAINEVSREILETLGYRVLVARGGWEAIEVYKTSGRDIDLVILDMIMPGLGGRETFDILKGINPDIRVILSSGYSIDGHTKTIMEWGVHAFIQKPFRIEEFSDKIRTVLKT